MEKEIIDLLKKDMKEIPSLKQDIALIKNDMTYMRENMAEVKALVLELSNRPKERWNTVVTGLISTIVGLGIGLLITVL
ncbi:MAG: hypothetical protein KAX49_07180 [Halanaerobiales bacterium]|nr:hypothetical protein [Halanaerobiales bacterium]